jgi:hypothetical protein
MKCHYVTEYGNDATVLCHTKIHPEGWYSRLYLWTTDKWEDVTCRRCRKKGGKLPVSPGRLRFHIGERCCVHGDLINKPKQGRRRGWSGGTAAHAHNGPSVDIFGIICFRPGTFLTEDGKLTSTVLHELAHIQIYGDGHSQNFYNRLRKLQGGKRRRRRKKADKEGPDRLRKMFPY